MSARTTPAITSLVFAAFLVALALNFLLCAGYMCWHRWHVARCTRPASH